MSARRGPNLAASVRQRLTNLARERGEDFGLMLTQFGLERLLYRLSLSEHGATFLLKGAMLLRVWTHEEFRPTRDVDLLGSGDPSLERLAAVFRDVCHVEVPPDGIRFDPASIVAERIKEDADYEGVRVTMLSYLEQARIPLQVDIGFGDVVTPAPMALEYPTLLDFPPPHIRAYPRETIVAEKLEAAVKLAMANSRMKDFYDLTVLAERFSFDGSVLAGAIRNTFARRGTHLQTGAFRALLDSMAEDQGKQLQWAAFIRKGRLSEQRAIAQVLLVIERFLFPPIEACVADAAFPSRWEPSGPWTTPPTA